MATTNIKDLAKALNNALKAYELADKALDKVTSAKGWENLNNIKGEAAQDMFGLVQALLVEVDEMLCATDRMDIHNHHTIELSRLF